MNLPRQLLLSISVFFLLQVQAQTEFENYQGLKALGDVPEDFTKVTLEKYQEEKKVKDDLEKDLLLSTNYSIDRILHSGMVVFNDPVSIYAKKVLKEVLKSEPSLYNEVRLYTLKSNEPNAFSTRQGILFITTGLIAQLENEAQLAFILAHEIAHYKKEHVIESYHENREIIRGKGEFKYSSKDDKIKYLSRYSKKKEFDADYIGLGYYAESGYSLTEIENVFNVLQYSYLPFDEVIFDQELYNDSALYIPDEFFPEEINEITASEDYDDSESSHPNIKNRKDYISLELEEQKSAREEGQKFLVGEKEFDKIRNICRFESIRYDIMKGAPVSALYSIFLLQRTFEDNYYLDKMEAIAWYKLLKFKNIGLISDITYSKNEIEGESHAIHYMVREFNKKQLNAVAFKRLYIIDKKYGFDSLFIHSLAEDAMIDMVKENTYKSDFVSELTYTEAKSEFEESKKELENKVENDTIDYVNPKRSSSEKSKYEKIREKKRIKKKSSKAKRKDDEWDPEDFYKYAYADILDELEFKKLVKLGEEAKEEEEEEEYLSYKERARIEKRLKTHGAKLGLDKILILSPEFQKWHYKKGFNNIKSEKGKISIGQMYRENCEKLGIDYQIIDKKTYTESEVEDINDINTVMNYIFEFVAYEEDNGGYFTTEYDQIQKISEKRGINYVVLPFVMIEEQKKLSGMDYIFVFIPYYLPYFIVKAVMPSNSILITNVVFNIKENKIEYVFSKFFRRKISNVHFVNAHIYDILSQISAEEKKGGNR